MSSSSNRFSVLDRPDLVKSLKEKTFDLLVIGGGITGAGIALDASSRGLKVALLEKKDYAWGTSSRSTKLIHGGLRYLKQMEFGLVKEVGMERAIVYKNARHLVIPEKMLLPIVKNGSLSKNMSSLALWVYDFLAGVKPQERRRMLNAEQTSLIEPLLRKDNLIGGAVYFEYRSDDARLTIENIKTAVNYGAICLNYAQVNGFSYDGINKIKSVSVEDLISGENYNIKTKIVVNAAGPWVDNLRMLDAEGVKGKRLFLSKGVHIVVPREKMPIQQSVYFDVKGDNRMVFAIPRDQITYLGTTDTEYRQSIDDPEPNIDDVSYILKAVNEMFPSLGLTIEDVQSSWTGLRPLIHEEGKSASELSRKDEIFYSETGLISIAGGKLTGYRKMAERVVDKVCQRLNINKKSVTRNLKLCGADFENLGDIAKYIENVSEIYELREEQVKRLVQRYGKNTVKVLEKYRELNVEVDDKEKNILLAELAYCVDFEQVFNLSDFLIRRTGYLYFDRDLAGKYYKDLAIELKKILQLDENEIQKQIKEFEKSYNSVIAFK
jgi:glycerol-3-phosphate dehydrogenase